MNQDFQTQNKKDPSIKERAPEPDNKAQLIWVALGIVAILLIWLISHLLYR